MSIGLRNELRSPDNNADLKANYYNWGNWYTSVVAANPDILIFLSGLNFDTQLGPIVAGTALSPSTTTFKKSDFTFANKLVLELHDYENSATSCSSMQSNLVSNGFSTLKSTAVNVFPMVLTEWGHNQADNSYSGVYASCLHSYLPAQHVGWTVWVIAGSYYIRSGSQDLDETWGVYTSLDFSELMLMFPRTLQSRLDGVEISLFDCRLEDHGSGYVGIMPKVHHHRPLL